MQKSIAAVASLVVLVAVAVATSPALAAPWTAAVESRTILREILDRPELANGGYWAGGLTYEGEAVVVRFDVAGIAEPIVVPFPGEYVSIVPSGSGGVYATDGQQVAVIDADGAMRWASSTGLGASFDVPRLFDAAADHVLLGLRTQDSSFPGRLRLARYRASDGALDWSVDLPADANECGTLVNVTAVRGGRLQVTCAGSARTIVRLFDSMTGSALPDVPLRVDGRDLRVQWVTSDASSDLFVGGDDGFGSRIFRIDPGSGEVRWATDRELGVSAFTSIVAPGLLGTIALGDSAEVILRTTDGSVAWQRNVGDLVTDGAGNGYAFARVEGAVNEFRVSGIDLASGAVRWADPEVVSSTLNPVARAGASPDGVVLAAYRGGSRQIVQLQGWRGNGVRRAPVAQAFAGTTYAYIDLTGDAALVARNAPDAAAGRTVARLVDAASGATSWESLVHESNQFELDVTGTCQTTNDTVVVASSRRNDTSPAGRARLVGFDRANGHERWHRDFGDSATGASIGSLFCDGSGKAYAALAERPASSDITTRVVLAIDGATGATAWQRLNDASGALAELQFTETTALGPLFSRRNPQSEFELFQLDAGSGATQWATAAPEIASVWAIARTNSGDPVLHSETGTVADRDLLVQRFDATTGAIRWSRRLDGPYGGRQLARSLSRGPADELFVAGRNTEGVSWGRGSMTRLDPVSGNVIWNVELPRPRESFASPGNTRLVTGAGVDLVRQSVSPVFDLDKPTRYELLALDHATGALRYGRVLGSGGPSPADPGSFTYEPASLTVTPDGELLTRRFEGGVGTRPKTLLQREPALATSTGDANVALTLGAAIGSAPQRLPFRIDVRYSGTGTLVGGNLRTMFPEGVVIESVQCRVEGAGRCGDATRLRQLRQSLDLAPGAHGIVQGTLQIMFPTAQLGDFRASFDLPFSIGDANLIDNLAVARPGPNATTDLVADQRFSGSWFNPQRSGEGWILEILPDGKALLFWFTYPPNGATGDQQWLIAQNGEVQGSRIIFDEIYLTSGTRFGAGFDASAVRLNRWGEIRIDFDDCNGGELTYSGRTPFGSATRTITRLTSLAGVECSGPSSPASAIRSGAWYDPARAGEGWIVEALPDGRATVYWFTYSPDGNQAWTFGTGTLVGDRLRIDDMRRPRGTRFGTGFNPANVNVAPWGTLQIDFSGCNGGTLSYTSSEAGYDNASRTITRLTRIAGTDCR